ETDDEDGSNQDDSHARRQPGAGSIEPQREARDREKRDERRNAVVRAHIGGDEQAEKTTDAADGGQQHGRDPPNPPGPQPSGAVRGRHRGRQNQRRQEPEETDGADQSKTRRHVFVVIGKTGGTLALEPRLQRRDPRVAGWADQVADLEAVDLTFRWDVRYT